MASLWLCCSCCPRFCPLCEAIAQHLPSLGLQKASMLLCDWNTYSHCSQWSFQVVQQLCDLQGPLSALIWLTSSFLTPGMNIFCANNTCQLKMSSAWVEYIVVWHLPANLDSLASLRLLSSWWKEQPGRRSIISFLCLPSLSLIRCFEPSGHLENVPVCQAACGLIAGGATVSLLLPRKAPSFPSPPPSTGALKLHSWGISAATCYKLLLWSCDRAELK